MSEQRKNCRRNRTRRNRREERRERHGQTDASREVGTESRKKEEEEEDETNGLEGTATMTENEKKENQS